MHYWRRFDSEDATSTGEKHLAAPAEQLHLPQQELFSWQVGAALAHTAVPMGGLDAQLGAGDSEHERWALDVTYVCLKSMVNVFASLS